MSDTLPLLPQHKDRVFRESAINEDGAVARQNSLRPGLIFEISRRAGVKVPDAGGKRKIRCPFHSDDTESAFVSERNVFYCSRCTPDAGWSAKRFAAAVKVPWPVEGASAPAESVATTVATKKQPSFTVADASDVWTLALRRARSDEYAEHDRAVYDYVGSRGLAESWERGAFGVLADEMPLPEALRSWPRRTYRLVAPLYDKTGSLANVQARAIANVHPKVLFPEGSSAAGTLFASASGLEVLRGTWRGVRRAILGEGLTDYLGLSIAAFTPVLSAPGTGMAARAIGPWVRGFEIFLALDWDDAGDNAVGITARHIHEHGATRVIRLDWPAHAKDACDLIAKKGVDGLSDFLRAHLHGS